MISIVLAMNLRDNSDGSLKSQNADLYYGQLHKEYYDFYQQYKDHFEFFRSLGHKSIPFTIDFLKNHILNSW